jgi:hypothetical protein
MSFKNSGRTSPFQPRADRPSDGDCRGRLIVLARGDDLTPWQFAAGGLWCNAWVESVVFWI